MTMDTRQLLLSTAARLFSRHGYAAVSLRQIAAEAGVTTGSLYHYFGHKDQIVEEILDAGHKQVHAEVARAIVAVGPSARKAEKVVVGIRAHLAAVHEMDSFPAANIRIFAHVPPEIRAAVLPSRKAYEQYWTELLASGRGIGQKSRVDVYQLTMFFFGAANWTLEWYREGRDSLDDIANNLAIALLGEEATALAKRRPAARASRNQAARSA